MEGGRYVSLLIYLEVPMGDRTPIQQLKGIGDKTAKLFNKLHIDTVEDLLVYFPRDYETFKEPIAIAETSVGSVTAVYGTVAGIPNVKKVRNLTIMNVLIKDNSGAMQLTFFNMPFLKNVLRNSSTFIFRGMIQSKGPSKIMEQPKIYKTEEYRGYLSAIQPRYSLTKGITNQTIQKAVKQALINHPLPAEHYPKHFMEEYELLTYKDALHNIHFPKNKDMLIQARRRMVFDEFFDFLYYLRQNKDSTEQLKNEYQMIETADTVRFLEVLPYELTKAQKKVWAEIRSDLNAPYCMNRLIQGDVGSGKTIIAILSLLMCVSNGYQGAMMAPTEVLATQHYEDVCEFIQKYHLS